MGPIIPVGKHMGDRYIITATDYLTRWAKATLIKDCTATREEEKIVRNVVTRFGCPKILISDQGTHFVNQLIEELMDEFQIQHRKQIHIIRR